jgi:hypothetical protein
MLLSRSVAARGLTTVTGMPNSERIRPPGWLKLSNKVFIQMSRLGITFGRGGPAVLTVAGRKSGKPRATPVTPMTVDGKQYVIAGFPDSDCEERPRRRPSQDFEAMAGRCAVFRLEPLGAEDS